MPTLTPTLADQFYGPDAHQRFDLYRHPTRDAGGNPLFIYRHGGGWQSRDKRLISADTDESNTLACALLGDPDVHFDVMSINTRQARWDTPVTAAFGYNEPSTVPAYYPEAWRDMQRAILYAKVASRDLGANPEKVVVGGSSAGACIALWTQLVPPMVSGASNESSAATGGSIQASVNVRQVGSDARTRYDSKALGVWYHLGLPDFRKQSGTESVNLSSWYSIFGAANATASAALPLAAREAVSAIALMEKGAVPPSVYACYAPTKKRFTGADYTASSGTITKTGEFASGYAAFQAGDLITAGTPSGAFTVALVSRVSNDAITVAANALGTSNLTGVVTGTITLGKPYGSGVRDVHDEQQGENLRAAGARLGVSIGLDVYTGSFKAAGSVAWMKGLVR